jgi:tetratricopeptide (TPR) repeat protein
MPLRARSPEGSSEARQLLGCALLVLHCLAHLPTRSAFARKPQRTRPGPVLPTAAVPEPVTRPDAGASAPQDCQIDPVCKQLTIRAKELSRANQHGQALDAYQGAYALHPSPWLLLNIGRLQYKLGRPQEAVVTLSRAMAQIPEDQPATRQRIQRFLSEAGQAAASLPPPAQPTPRAETYPAIPPTPLHKRWQLWTVVGGALALGTAAVAVGLTVRPPFDPGDREVFHVQPALIVTGF